MSDSHEARDPEAAGDEAIDVDPEALADAPVPPGDLDDVARERDEMRALAQRVQADFENFRKRTLREQTALVEKANASLLGALLPVLDQFELAVDNLDGTDDAVRKGVELAYANFVTVLEQAGLERIPTDGAAFDPEVHEAVMHDAGDGDPTVVETMRTGWRLKGQVLRPAMVKVAG